MSPSLQDHYARALLERLDWMASSGQRRVLALNGPVGVGKTSLCRLVAEQASRRGLRLAVASIDDFYRPWAERQTRLLGNPFGVSRVPPGSHDTALLLQSLTRWQAGDPLLLPCFDKTLRHGHGDRCGEERLAPDVLLLEGWLLGCRPLGPAALLAVVPETLARLSAAERDWLPHWDRELQAYLPVWERIQDLWLLRPSDWSWPRRWRFQAEGRQRRGGGGWLNGSQLDALVRASLCSLPPLLYQDPLARSAHAVAWLDGRRRWRAVRIGAEAAQASPASSSPSVG